MSELVGNPEDRFSGIAAHMQKQRQQVSFAVTVKLISVFVFATSCQDSHLVRQKIEKDGMEK